MALASAVAWRRAARYGVQPFDQLALGVLASVAGVLGASLLYAAIHWSELAQAPRAFLARPGLVFYGGLLGALGAALAYARLFRVPLGGAADAAAPAVPLGHAVGRLGCFLGGCCFGRPTTSPLGVRFTHPGTPAAAACALAGPIHPVQLYEAAGLGVIALGVALAGRRGRQPPGALFFLYLVLYALLRLATEPLRGDGAARGYLVAGWVSTSQAIAVTLLAAALVAYLGLRRKGRPA
jgi:phosphatidylglycerol:prolipoprotein diacylglycerol transferase